MTPVAEQISLRGRQLQNEKMTGKSAICWEIWCIRSYLVYNRNVINI